MISTGNDIIDLSKINEQRSIEYRFYSKFLNRAEQEYFNHLPLDRLIFIKYVWLLWSVKESAYKYLKRLKPELMFSPVNINVFNIDFKPELSKLNHQDTTLSGEVKIQEQHLIFRSVINDQYIASAVNMDKDFKNFFSGVLPSNASDYESQSQAAKIFAINELSAFIPGDLSIQKSAVGYPVVYLNNRAINLPLSLAHHGNYAAYSFVFQDELSPA